MATLIQGKTDWVVRSDRGTMLGFGRTPDDALRMARLHKRIVELGAEIVIREGTCE